MSPQQETSDRLREPIRVKRGIDPGLALTMVVLVLGSFAALSIDVVRTGFGIKGDEATYVAMALSVAHDGDLSYEAEDIERFYRTYKTGPEGIFLKRGTEVSYQITQTFPFIKRETQSEESKVRLFFGKAYAYSVAVAPFVRLAGLNGFLFFHVLLLSGMLFLGYRFLVARSPKSVSAVYVTGFFGASIVPLYTVWWTSDIFNVACVFVAYFFWFYKEVAPPAKSKIGELVRSHWSDVLAVLLLGIATYSKPTHILLIIPPVSVAIWRHQFTRGVLITLGFACTVAAAFAVNAGITGDFNYQGGDRRTFYGHFPFEQPDDQFETLGVAMATNQVVVEERLSPGSWLKLLFTNLWYFFFGRHFGFLPFFFPGILAVGLFFWRRSSWHVWQCAIFLTVVLSAVAIVIYMPYTWSGGGGPSGNRYFLSIYPALFFITPPLVSITPAVVGWIGGALFTAHILVNPFLSAKQPYLTAQQGALRMLPVELTMVNDLPVMLETAPSRARIRYGDDPALSLYFLDHNAYLPDPSGIWIAGGERSDLIVRSAEPLLKVEITLRAPIANEVDIAFGGDEKTVELTGRGPEKIVFKPKGVYSRRSWAYFLSIRTERGFVPRFLSATSEDSRYLGARLNLQATVNQGDSHVEGDR